MRRVSHSTASSQVAPQSPHFVWIDMSLTTDQWLVWVVRKERLLSTTLMRLIRQLAKEVKSSSRNSTSSTEDPPPTWQACTQTRWRLQMIMMKSRANTEHHSRTLSSLLMGHPLRMDHHPEPRVLGTIGKVLRLQHTGPTTQL